MSTFYTVQTFTAKSQDRTRKDIDKTIKAAAAQADKFLESPL